MATPTHTNPPTRVTRKVPRALLRHGPKYHLPKGRDLIASTLDRGLESWKQIYLAPAVDLVRMVEAGIQVAAINTLADDMQIGSVRLLETLGLPRSTITRKAKLKANLNTTESERVLGMMRLVGQVEQMVAESGNPQGFDASTWVADWLEQPLSSLGGKTPASFMNTTTGQKLVSSLLSQAQSGAFA